MAKEKKDQEGEKKDVDEDEPLQDVAVDEVAVDGEEVEDDGKYVFAMAPIVRIMKEELDEDKMIRRRVKEGMNIWLEKLCRKIAKKMNESDYTMVEIDDFKTAIEPYEMIDDVEQERARLVATMEKIKQDCDGLIMDVNRKFITP